MKVKVSVYMNEEEKLRICKNSIQYNTSISDYLLHKGLEQPIQSDHMKSTIASLACRLYHLANSVEHTALRSELIEIGGAMYGVLEG